jgi:predicted DsbA family dithiol-disulfide isomerase
MLAYWSEGADIGDEETLLALVAEAGLDGDDASEALADGRFAERVQASTREANLHGINAVPAFVLDRRLLLLGAQPEELFERAVSQLSSAEREGGP